MNPEDYIASFSFDLRLAPYDIEGSIAHVQMLSKKRIIGSGDAKKIIKGLKTILSDLKRGKSLPPAEDIHFAIENELIRKIGKVAKKMHTARSRNDQVALDLKLFSREMGLRIIESATDLQASLLRCAQKNIKAFMPGMTHLQHGQPVSFAHHILSYAWMLERDKNRIKNTLKILDESPLGACAMAGTTFPIDRSMTAKMLGFSKVTENSFDTVSDRDFIGDLVYNCTTIMLHLSRLAEELIVWSSSEFNYVTMADPYVTGSSIMPQKKNPDAAELLRGKSSRTVGSLVQLITLFKSQPLSYNRDMQEDKPPLFEAVDTTIDSLSIASQLIDTLKVNAKKLAQSCESGFLQATELADYLAKKGVPFRQAHSIVAGIVDELRSDEEMKSLTEITLKELKSHSPLFEKDVAQVLSIEHIVGNRNSYGGTGHKALSNQIKKLKTLLK